MTTSPSEPVDNAQPQGTNGSDQVSSEPGVIDDSQLPEDLQPSDDNPLARNPDEEGSDADAPQSTSPVDKPHATEPTA